jgi:hypothetical protein
MNWSRVTSFSSPAHMWREDYHPVAIAFGLSAFIAAVLAVLCVRMARRCLESGQKVPPGRWIHTYAPIFYALPLLFHSTGSSTSLAAGGGTTVVSGGYGHELSSWVFLFAVTGMLLAQIAIRLYRDPEVGSHQAFSQFVRG